MSYLVCGIWEKRPPVCKKYPQQDSFIMESCGYHFTGGERHGACYADCQASCCMQPREGGLPGGAALPEIAGGRPCKHLIDVDKAPEGMPIERKED